MNIFAVATRMKLRFQHKGACTVEDLWDIDVEILDDMYQTLAKKLKGEGRESLLKTRTIVNKELTLKTEVLKYVVETKLEESDKRKKVAEKRLKNKRLRELIVQKENEELQGKSLDELNALLEDEDEGE